VTSSGYGACHKRDRSSTTRAKDQVKPDIATAVKTVGTGR
jgi:hypothetical protein